MITNLGSLSTSVFLVSERNLIISGDEKDINLDFNDKGEVFSLSKDLDIQYVKTISIFNSNQNYRFNLLFENETNVFLYNILTHEVSESVFKSSY